jgi:hypothetical protein
MTKLLSIFDLSCLIACSPASLSAFATPELDAVRRQFAALVPPNQQQQSLSDAALLVRA